MMRRRIFALMRKEFIEVLRDRRTLFMILIMPSLMLTLFGYALTTDIKHISTAVIDNDSSRLSRDFIDRFRRSGYFDIKGYADDPAELKDWIDGGRIRVGIIIPRNFSENISSGKDAQLQVILDGSESNTASVALGYIDAINQDYVEKMFVNALRGGGINDPERLRPIDLRSRVWYNPELKSVNFLVPGTLCILLIIITAVLTVVAVVKESENGTMEGLLSTPLRRRELILGKILPPICIAYAMSTLALLVATLWFRVPVKGSVPLLLFLMGVAIICALGIGLFISTIAVSQREALLINFAINFLPTVLLSGFVFPISSMPMFLQFITYFVPARYFLAIIRGIMFKGAGLGSLWGEALALSLFAAVLIVLSVFRFREKLKF